MSVEIPRLETNRLLPREFVASDLDPLSEFHADPEMVRYLGRETMNRAATWTKLASMVGHWQLRGFGYWALEEKTTGDFVGRAGIWFPEGRTAPEVAWSVMKQHQGKGFATEAGLAAANWAFSHLKLESLISPIVPGNEASIAVATKIGERFDRMEEVAGVECCIYKVNKGELTG